MTGAFEAISAAAGPSVPAREVSNFVSGVHARVAKADGLNASGTAGASTPDGDRRAAGCHRGRDRLAPGRPRACWSGTSRTARPAAELLAAAGPGPISDDASLLGHVDAVIAANPRAVADYRAGRPVAGFFVGQVMKATGGAADAARVTTLVRERLDAGD